MICPLYRGSRCIEVVILGFTVYYPVRCVMVKMDPPKLVPPGTNFSINKDPPNCKIWTPFEKFGPPPRDEIM